MTINWQKEIVNMARVKEELYEVDNQQLWSWHLPEIAATEMQVNELENCLGYALNSQYKLFLMYANGWQSFYHDVDLFGTKDLLDSKKSVKAKELLEVVIESCPDEKIIIEEILPIAVSKDDIDIFIINNENSSSPGVVSWFAGYRIDTFANFEEYFMSMIKYNKLTIQSSIKY